MAQNKQYGNVANKGDIIKHLLLVALANWFKQHRHGRSAWLDSHTFLLQAPLSNENWQTETDLLAELLPANELYKRLQTDYIAKGQYRCSSGLIMDLLPDVDYLLSEVEPDTRQSLRSQLNAEGVTAYTLLSDLSDWQHQSEIKPYDSLLALCDPFQLNETDWEAMSKALGTLLKPEGMGIVLVFDYHVDSSANWPSAPAGWCGPVYTVRQTPYQLAVYTTMGISAEIEEMFTIPGGSSS